jgi:hypothetical protein
MCASYSALLVFLSGLLRVVVLAALLLPAAASAVQFGSYRCWSYNVSGGGGSCRLAAPITIRADGTYQESSTSGTYRVDGNRIYFSKSTIRGPGVISGGNQITFDYDYRGWHHTVTYLCQDCSAASGAAKPSAAGAMVWVAVRLNFDRSDGYLDWANSAHLVPAAQAAQFAASTASTPPPGSSTGSAYAEDRQTVVANFRRAAGGQDYVVFLDSGRQRIPVASVHVPATPAEQTLNVNASLDYTPSAPPEPRSSNMPAGEGGDAENLAGALGALAEALQGLTQPEQAQPAPDYPKIGIEAMDVTPEIARAVGNPALRGAGVRSLMPGAPAEKAGLREGDIITQVNGKAVTGAQELIQALAHRKSGAASHLSVYRGGRTMTIVVP